MQYCPLTCVARGTDTGAARAMLRTVTENTLLVTVVGTAVGGRARAATLSPEERSASAKRGAAGR